MSRLSYEKMLNAVQHEFISMGEVVRVSQELVETVSGVPKQEALQLVRTALKGDHGGTDCDLDAEHVLSIEVAKHMGYFETFGTQANIAESIWKAKSRRDVLDIAWEMVLRGELRPTRNSTEKFDLTEAGEVEVERWRGAE